MPRIKLVLTAAIKAKRAWDRLPPERRARLLEGAKATVRTQGPVVAKKVADTARTQGPVVAKAAADTAQRAADTARARGPVIARRIAQAIDRARKGA